MNATNRCCYRHTDSQYSMRPFSNYCFLLILVLAIGGWFIQVASAQVPSGTLVLVGPTPDASPNADFLVSVEILNPENVAVFTISIEYPTVFTWVDWSVGVVSGNNQFNVSELSLEQERNLIDGRKSRLLNLRNNSKVVSEGTLLTITFQTSEIGNHQVELVDSTYIQSFEAEVTDITGDLLPGINVSVRGPMAGTVAIAPAPGLNGTRLNETSFVDIELKNRTRAHSYEITVDPSDNLGSLTVSYNADDTNITAITNHTAGDPITLRADLWLPNDPIDADNLHSTEWRVTHNDPIVATLFFTPTTAGEGSFTITAAKIFNSDNTELTLSNPDTLTFTVAAASDQVIPNNTGAGLKPVITVRDGVKQGPFKIEIHFESENHTEHVINDHASLLWPRGVYGFARDDIVVSGAGASVTTRLWEADGAQLYYARINPTETGPLTIEISVPADVAYEVGTNLPNVASATVTVQVNLEYPPWDVDRNGMIQVNDVELVEEALGQGLEENAPNFAFYRNTITDPKGLISDEEYRRRDVNGDLYVNQVDLDLVRMHMTDEADGVQGRSEVRGQSEGLRYARSITPPDASVWMPDENLRKAVRKALGIAKGVNFSQGQVATLTKLTADKAWISNITGLEHATSLKKLDLRKNQIVDVGSLEGLTELTELKIGYNDISDISALGGLTKLAHLGLAENEISDISALSNLSNLKELWLRDNNVSDIAALGDLSKLTNLNLKNNAFSNITALGNLSNLKELWLRDNNISDITALGNLKKLTHMSLRDNEISGISALQHLTNLRNLWLQENNISDVSPLSSLTKLKKLGLSDNPILDTSPLYSLTQGALKNIDITVSQYPPWDVNEDGSVDATDSALVTAALGQTGNAIVNARTDVNSDDTVNQEDLTLVTDNMDTDGGAPSSVDVFALMDPETLENLDRSVLERYLNTLRAESDGSLKYERAIALLERILAMIRPNQTQLLANYPNPFNPETWIPYQLANASNVEITIYDTTCKVVRRLDLGHQPEGYYTSKVRAAYWDGRNGFGERVASGIYFYQLQTDNISFLRKLLILK